MPAATNESFAKHYRTLGRVCGCLSKQAGMVDNLGRWWNEKGRSYGADAAQAVSDATMTYPKDALPGVMDGIRQTAGDIRFRLRNSSPLPAPQAGGTLNNAVQQMVSRVPVTSPTVPHYGPPLKGGPTYSGSSQGGTAPPYDWAGGASSRPRGPSPLLRRPPAVMEPFNRDKALDNQRRNEAAMYNEIVNGTSRPSLPPSVNLAESPGGALHIGLARTASRASDLLHGKWKPSPAPAPIPAGVRFMTHTAQ